jgi:putative lipoprotein
MRFGFVLLFGSFHFGAPPERAPEGNRWFGRDKAYHFAASAAIQSLTHGVLRGTGSDYRTASGFAGLTTLAIGVGKEVHDRADGRYFSWRDLAADAAGGVTGAVVVRQVDR